MIEFNILNIGAFCKAQSKPPPLHSHEEWQWDFLTSGKIRMVFKDEAVTLLPGDSLLTPPWLPHTLFWLKNCDINSFHFKWPEAPPISRDAGIPIKGGSLSPVLLEHFFHYAPFSDEASRANTACCLHLLLSRYFKNSSADSSAVNSLKEAVFRHLEKNNFQPAPIGEVAKSCRMSVNHFIRMFKAETGETPARFIAGVRMKRAMELMRHSEMNLTGIAMTLGFPDLYSFSKAFKRSTGQTPVNILHTRG